MTICVDVPSLVRLTWIQMLSVGLRFRLGPTQKNFTALIKCNLESNLGVKSLIRYKKIDSVQPSVLMETYRMFEKVIKKKEIPNIAMMNVVFPLNTR